MTQSGKINLIIIIGIVVLALAISGFIMFKFVLKRGGGEEAPEPVEEPPCPKAWLELAEFQDMAINPNGPQRAIVQLSLLFEHCQADKKVPLELEKILPLLKADVSFFLQSQSLEDFGIDNRHMLEEELRVLVNNHLEDVDKGLTSVRITSFVVQYL